MTKKMKATHTGVLQCYGDVDGFQVMECFNANCEDDAFFLQEIPRCQRGVLTGVSFMQSVYVQSGTK